MENKHTPGPWFAVRNSAFWEVNPQRNYDDKHIPYTVADCCASDPDDTTGLQEANARLIAAAPDLLKNLEMALLWLEYDGRYDVQSIKLAIAKAKGQIK